MSGEVSDCRTRLAAWRDVASWMFVQILSEHREVDVYSPLLFPCTKFTVALRFCPDMSLVAVMRGGVRREGV
jgi:hypothetical protein